MKAVVVLLLFASACVSVNAQSPQPTTQGPPDLLILKFSWSKERLNWERDPFSAPNENLDELRVRMRNERRMQEAKRNGSSQMEINKIEREARADAAIFERMKQKRPARYGFLYKATFRNTGEKAVVAIDWDYVFSDAATQQELGRRQFTSEERVAPGKKKEFSFFIPSPPTNTISADALNSHEREQLAESVIVTRLVYADGTVWHRR